MVSATSVCTPIAQTLTSAACAKATQLLYIPTITHCWSWRRLRVLFPKSVIISILLPLSPPAEVVNLCPLRTPLVPLISLPVNHLFGDSGMDHLSWKTLTNKGLWVDRCLSLAWTKYRPRLVALFLYRVHVLSLSRLDPPGRSELVIL